MSSLSMPGKLELYSIPTSSSSQENPKTYQLPVFLAGQDGSDKALIFIGGLSDGMGSVPYVTTLDELTKKLGWTFAQPLWSSAYQGYALGSLKRDVRELQACVKHLQTQGKSTIVLMGHSTGCQDIMTYLLTAFKTTPISGAIMQAPVSDREAFTELDHELVRDEAAKMVEQGRADELLPRDMAKKAFGTTYATAYRAWSLLCNGGDDDFFSSDLPASETQDSPHRPLSQTFGKLSLGIPIVCLFSGADEYTPPQVDKKELFDRWKAAAEAGNNDIDLRFAVVEGASHNVKDQDKQIGLAKIVERILVEIMTKGSKSGL